ncbi:MAG: acetaldehyde dehydrogenase (acetylating) [Eubacteriales bacterium]
MMQLDFDLSSLQEARDLLRKAKQAQAFFAEASQEEVDRVVAAMAEAGQANAEWLARMAVDETKIGVFEDKVFKNLFASRDVHSYIKGVKTVGIIAEDPEARVYQIAAPMGVVLGITPTTNPTSTVIYKCLISIKARNGIVIAPHPSAARCSYAAAEVLHEAAKRAGAPDGIIGCMTKPTMAATNELMRHDHTAIILATGGSAMVKAAYSAGKPAYGVGPGNVPVYIERSADIPQAVSDIMTSKTFDNGTICASEQSIIVDRVISDQVKAEMVKQGACFLNREETDLVSKALITRGGGVNPGLVGRSPAYIAEKCGISIPAGTRLIVAPLLGVGPEHPLSREKLSPVIGYYEEEDWHTACLRCIELLNLGGLGHSLVIHSQNEEVIMEFAEKKPVFRILVNTPSAHGAIGATTGLVPALTLGCGTWGNNSTSDNVSPLHLINRKRLAYNLKSSKPAPVNIPVKTSTGAEELTNEVIATVVRQVLAKMA